MGNRRYSIYSIKDGGEKRARGISELRGQESTPWTHKSFVYKRRLISQAGRRGFEPRLPLHKINNLQAIGWIQNGKERVFSRFPEIKPSPSHLNASELEHGLLCSRHGLLGSKA
jgi:hypothetical protein